MKKLLLAIPFIFVANLAHADGHGHGGWHRGGWGGGYWLAPALIGGLIGYELSRPRTVYVEPAPRREIVVSEPMYSSPPLEPVYKEYDEYDSRCDCYVRVLRQVGWH